MDFERGKCERLDSQIILVTSIGNIVALYWTVLNSHTSSTLAKMNEGCAQLHNNSTLLW